MMVMVVVISLRPAKGLVSLSQSVISGSTFRLMGMEPLIMSLSITN